MYTILKIGEHPYLLKEASHWFCEKWQYPQQAYMESMQVSLQQIAKQLLDQVCEDARQMNLSTLYLCTSHTSFYERYG